MKFTQWVLILLICSPLYALRVAVVGDFGNDSAEELAVSRLVKSWNPDFVMTVGDNNYPSGEAKTIDTNIGKYYSDYIFPYKGKYGIGSTENRFYPTLGNHDWDTGPKPYFDYFSYIQRKRYYAVVEEGHSFFMLNSNRSEPDGTNANSKQSGWLQRNMRPSKKKFNFIFFHHPPYTSISDHEPEKNMQWPFKKWGADAVFTGHQHFYERLMVDGLPYYINGSGGNGLYKITKLDPRSKAHNDIDHGAMLIDIQDKKATISFYTVQNKLIDQHVITK